MAAITFPKAGKADAAPSTTATKSVEDLKSEVQDRITQIHATQQEQSAYLSSDDIAELQKMETLLNGSLALLEQFEKTGAMMPATTGVDTTGGPQLSSANMVVGWNGGFQSDTSDPNCEVIMPYNQGTDVKNGLVFKMDDTMESVKGKNVGADIEVTVTYKDQPDKKYLLKGMVANPTPLIIAADQTTVGVKVDFSQVKRTGNDPKKVDLTILGGSGDDTLIGSQGNDQIYGNAGDDEIYGMGGINTIDGGAGNDEINSVNKFDTISGGEGYDKVYATEKDALTAAKFAEETNTIVATAVNKDENFSGTGWVAEEKDTELSITKKSDTSDGGEINLKVPDGVMVYSKQDGTDLVLTYQPVGEDGIPGEPQVVRIHDVLNSQSRTKINITSESGSDHPSIIDMGNINTQFNQITLTKGQGDDVIIPPKTAMDDLGINTEDIGKATFDVTTTKKLNDAMEKDSKTHWATGDNGDSIADFPGWKSAPKPGPGEITLYPKDGQEVLDLRAPEMDGYNYDSSVSDNSKPDETTVTIFMKKDGWTPGDPVDRLVLHIIKTGNGNPKTITVGGDAPHNAAEAVKLIDQ